MYKWKTVHFELDGLHYKTNLEKQNDFVFLNIVVNTCLNTWYLINGSV